MRGWVFIASLIYLGSLDLGFVYSCSAQDMSETRKKIIVIDTPLSDKMLKMPYMCKIPSLSSVSAKKSSLSEIQLMGVDYKYRHAENVIGLIGSRIDSTKYCVLHIAFYFPAHEPGLEGYYNALYMVQQQINVVGVNLSISTGVNNVSMFEDTEFKLLKTLNEKKIKVNTSIGNTRQLIKSDNCGIFPACLKYKMPHPELFTVVGTDEGYHKTKGCSNLETNKDNSDLSLNYGKDLNRKKNCYANQSDYLNLKYESSVDQGSPSMVGTSQATAIHTGKMFSK